jgi:hypothetical protein
MGIDRIMQDVFACPECTFESASLKGIFKHCQTIITKKKERIAAFTNIAVHHMEKLYEIPAFRALIDQMPG